MHADRSAPIMRFPWQKRKVEQPTDFPLKLNTDNLNWCRDARLLLIEGNGTLKWESRGRNEDWSQQYALTLRGTPLIVHNAPECPTCAGLLATGYGLDKADAPELQQISDVINAPYVDLDTSIASMAPLLGLLSSGLYVIADGDSFPADGNGNFFWDVPDAFSNVEATGPAWYNDPDFEFTYSEGAPVFLYPSQPRTRLNQERVDYYTQRFDTTDTFPRAIAFYCAEGISVLLDGHHKACAAARLGRQLPVSRFFRLAATSMHRQGPALRLSRTARILVPLPFPYLSYPPRYSLQSLGSKLSTRAQPLTRET